MSRTVARIINGFAGIATLPLNSRQRRKTLARLACHLEQTALLTVETDKGPLYLYAGRGAGVASAAERFHEDEPETLEWIDRYIRPGDILWDIGANVGLYSLYAALTANVTVYAFEPSGLNFTLLVEHIERNGRGEAIKPMCVALGAETKIETLHVGEFAPGHASNAVGDARTQFQSFDPVFAQAVPAFRADDFIQIFKLSGPDHIKLDVDGIEGVILSGASKVLKKVKTLIVEVEGENAEAAEAIEKPLLKAGFEEDISCREKGSCRNRLYVNPARLAENP